MKITLVFDVYGTLIDSAGVKILLQGYVGDTADRSSDIWRSKQLEYSFRRGLMQNYKDFPTCTKDALNYANVFMRTKLTLAQRDNLIEEYLTLPAFPDVKKGLSMLNSTKKFKIFAFSNGLDSDLHSLLVNAGIENYFADIISVDKIKSYKPNPAVYAYFLRKSESSGLESWLISSNPFDVIGAISAGMRAIWVKQSADAIFDPWEIGPTIIIKGIDEIYSVLKGNSKKENKENESV